MSEEDTSLGAVLARLRGEFDQSFAVAPGVRLAAEHALVVVGVGSGRIAVLLHEIGGLLAHPEIVAVPSRAPDLLGIVGIRGGLVPVFSLAMLMGESRDPEPPAWLVLCAGEPLGLAAARFLGHFRASAEAFRPIPAAETRSPHVGRVVTLDETPIPVLSVTSVVRFLVERNFKE